MSAHFDPDEDARQHEVARRLIAYAAKLKAEEEATCDDELAGRLMAYATKLKAEAKGRSK